jgi:hypothetical protein
MSGISRTYRSGSQREHSAISQENTVTRITKLFAGIAINAVCALSATLHVVPSIATPSVGAILTVDVNIADVPDLYAFQFDLTFQPGVLAAQSIVDGGFLTAATFFPGFIDNAAGKITFVAGSLSGIVSGVSGGGTLTRVQFLAAGRGTSSIAVANPVLLNSSLIDILVSATNPASVAVTDAGGAIPEPGTVTLLMLAGAAGAAVRTRPATRR